MTAALLETLNLAVDSALLTLIWLVQLIIYPAFAEIPKERFHDWHRKYMNTISVIVIPLMLAQATLVARHLVTAFSWIDAAAAGCILAAWIVTFTLSVPCHQQLKDQGNEPASVRRLVAGNGLRTLAWTAAWILRLIKCCA